MDNKILEILLDMQKELKEIKLEQKTTTNEINSIKQDMKDRFDVVDIKLNMIENKVTQVSSKLDSTSNQVVRNIETIENIKIKLQ